jgi:peroxiredoxin Q/BCP
MFTSKNVQVYGVSIDGPDLHRKFRASLSLPFPLLADEDGAVSTLFDSVALHEGKKYSARKLVLVDDSGVVVYRDDEYRIDAADFDALIAAVNAL